MTTTEPLDDRWEKSKVTICGESYPKHLYCGAIYDFDANLTKMTTYDPGTDGGRTRIVPDSTVKATEINSCYEGMGTTFVKNEKEYMYPNAGSKPFDLKRRVGFLRGTEFKTFKDVLEPLRPMPDPNDPNLYPPGYKYQNMVYYRKLSGRPSYGETSGGNGGDRNVMAMITIDETHKIFQGPCSAFDEANRVKLEEAEKEASDANEEAKTTDAAATALEDKADVSGDEKDIIIAQLSREVADAAEQKRKDAQAAVDALTPPTLNVLDRFLGLNLGVQIGIISGAVVLLLILVVLLLGRGKS
jgi:hypothetical protein